jgi:hypothetical protein
MLQVPNGGVKTSKPLIVRIIKNVFSTNKGRKEESGEIKSEFKLLSGSDLKGFNSVVTKVSSRVLKSNPRRIKQFINVFRLQLLIALQTGVLAPTENSNMEAYLPRRVSYQCGKLVYLQQ